MKKPHLKAPRRMQDMRIRHMAAYEHPLFIERGASYDAEMIIAFVSKFAQLHPTVVGQLPYNDLKKYYKHCVGLFEGFQLGAPSPEITINGTEYELINLKQPPTSWVVDCDNSDFEKDPVLLACRCYIPKGTKYGEVDEHGVLKYPASDRHEIFGEHFPLQQYLNLQGFFLQQYTRYARRYTAIISLKRKAAKFKRKMRGWMQSIWSLKKVA